jgi:hypothetical protein
MCLSSISAYSFTSLSEEAAQGLADADQRDRALKQAKAFPGRTIILCELGLNKFSKSIGDLQKPSVGQSLQESLTLGCKQKHNA